MVPAAHEAVAARATAVAVAAQLALGRALPLRHAHVRRAAKRGAEGLAIAMVLAAVAVTACVRAAGGLARLTALPGGHAHSAGVRAARGAEQPRASTAGRCQGQGACAIRCAAARPDAHAIEAADPCLSPDGRPRALAPRPAVAAVARGWVAAGSGCSSGLRVRRYGQQHRQRQRESVRSLDWERRAVQPR